MRPSGNGTISQITVYMSGGKYRSIWHTKISKMQTGIFGWVGRVHCFLLQVKLVGNQHGVPSQFTSRFSRCCFTPFLEFKMKKKKKKKTAPKITTPSKNLAMSSSHTIHCHKRVNICQQLSEVYNMSDICYCSYILAGPRGGLWLRSQVSDITHCGIHMWYIYMFAHVI